MQSCNYDVVAVQALEDYKVYLQFADGYSGKVNIAEIVPFEGVFTPLKDKSFFARVSVNSELGSICWDNGADLSPAYLQKISKLKIFV